MKKYTKQIISVIVVVIIAVFVIVISPRQMQNDTFWSIKVGEKIVKEGVFGVDTFSIHEGLQYVAHHFLTDVLIYVVYSFSGFDGLYVLEVILALIMAGLLYLLNKHISKNSIISVVALFIELLIMTMFIAVRAQMISFILFILEIILLEKYIASMKNENMNNAKNSNKRYLIGLSIIPILLANFHMGTVPFYFVILGVYIISQFRIKIPVLEWTKSTNKKAIKELIIVGIIGLITIFINPYFIDGVIYPFKTFGNDFINTNIIEFKPYSIGLDNGWSLIYIALIVIILLFNKKKILTRDFLLIFGTMFMSFTAIRYVSLFVICSAVVLRYLDNISSLFTFDKETIKSLKVTSVILMVLISLTLLSRYMLNLEKVYIPKEAYPIDAVEFLKCKVNENTVIFNLYNWGSYLMLNDIKVFIDSRCDLYTKEYNSKDIAGDYSKLMKCDEKYKEIVEKYGINLVIIPIDGALATLLEENVEFERIYKDDMAVVYSKI